MRVEGWKIPLQVFEYCRHIPHPGAAPLTVDADTVLVLTRVVKTSSSYNKFDKDMVVCLRHMVQKIIVLSCFVPLFLSMSTMFMVLF